MVFSYSDIQPHRATGTSFSSDMTLFAKNIENPMKFDIHNFFCPSQPEFDRSKNLKKLRKLFSVTCN